MLRQSGQNLKSYRQSCRQMMQVAPGVLLRYPLPESEISMSTESSELRGTASLAMFQNASRRLRELEVSCRPPSAPATPEKKAGKGKAKAAAVPAAPAAPAVQCPPGIDELVVCRAIGNFENYLKGIASDIFFRYPALMKNDAISFENMMEHESINSLLQSMVAARVALIFADKGVEEFARLLNTHLCCELWQSDDDRGRLLELLAWRRTREWSVENPAEQDNTVAVAEVLDFCDRLAADFDKRISAVLFSAPVEAST